VAVTLTESAVVAARAAVEDEEPLPLGIRVGVVGGGCSGYSYAIDFVDDGADEEDMVLRLEGIDVYIDPHSAQLLSGTEIDYIDTLQRRGFVFNNPNANTTCGCGSSFS
jgi:iron-sulfur cluster assembly protein